MYACINHCLWRLLHSCHELSELVRLYISRHVYNLNNDRRLKETFVLEVCKNTCWVCTVLYCTLCINLSWFHCIWRLGGFQPPRATWVAESVMFSGKNPAFPPSGVQWVWTCSRCGLICLKNTAAWEKRFEVLPAPIKERRGVILHEFSSPSRL